MTFGGWLLDQHSRRDDVGQLAREITLDIEAGCLKSSPRTPYTLETHLAVRHRGRTASPYGAVAKAEFEWRESLTLAPHQSWIGTTPGGSL